jgi:hypothetical protein
MSAELNERIGRAKDVRDRIERRGDLVTTSDDRRLQARPQLIPGQTTHGREHTASNKPLKQAEGRGGRALRCDSGQTSRWVCYGLQSSGQWDRSVFDRSDE